MLVKARTGLVQQKKQVTRGGKTYTTTVWVKPDKSKKDRYKPQFQVPAGSFKKMEVFTMDHSPIDNTSMFDGKNIIKLGTDDFGFGTVHKFKKVGSDRVYYVDRMPSVISRGSEYRQEQKKKPEKISSELSRNADRVLKITSEELKNMPDSESQKFVAMATELDKKLLRSGNTSLWYEVHNKLYDIRRSLNVLSSVERAFEGKDHSSKKPVTGISIT